MGSTIGRVRRWALWLAGGVSVVLGVALVYLVVTPGSIASVGTAALGAMLGLMILPAATLGAVRLEQRTRPRRAGHQIDVIARIGPARAA